MALPASPQRQLGEQPWYLKKPAYASLRRGSPSTLDVATSRRSAYLSAFIPRFTPGVLCAKADSKLAIR